MVATVSSPLFLKPNLLKIHLSFPSIQAPNLSNRRKFQNLSCFINKSTNFSTTSRIYVPKTSSFIKRKQQQLSFNSIDDDDGSSSSGFNDVVVAADAIIGVVKSITKPAMVVVLLSALGMICGPYNTAAIAASRSSTRSSSSESYRTTSPDSGFLPSSEPQPMLPTTSSLLSPSGGVGVNIKPKSSSNMSDSSPAHSVSPSLSRSRKYKKRVYKTVARTPLDPWSLFIVYYVTFTASAALLLTLACHYQTADYTVSNLYDADKTSVVKLQVGLLRAARSLQKDLNRIAQVADTSTPKGLSYVLTETTVALLLHPDFWVSGYSSAYMNEGMKEWEKLFNQLSIEEWAKFVEETLANMYNIKRTSTSNQRASESCNKYIVITILVAAKGVHELPAIKSGSDLKETLQKLGSIHISQTMAVEVLWTPQNENDSLSKQELLKDYPMLRRLSNLVEN